MSAEIIPFPERSDPHIAGQAICNDCGYLWPAVAPVGTAYLKCPSCLDGRGKFRHPVLRGGDHWQCRCEGTLFRVTRDMIYCAECGLEQFIGD